MTDYNSNHTNSTNDLNRLTAIMRHEKSKDRKHLLKIEIAKAKDRTVKHALETMLADIEREERRKKLLGAILFLILCLVSLLALFYFTGSNDQSNRSADPDVEEIGLEETSSSQRDKLEVDSTKLTETQVKDWVYAVLVEKYPSETATKMNSFDYIVKLGEDSLVYIDVMLGSESKQIGYFRINEQGKLEESGRFREDISPDEWLVISNEYQDISEVEYVGSFVEDRQSTQESSDMTAEQFARLYAKWQGVDYPVVDASDSNPELVKNVPRFIIYKEQDSNTLFVAESDGIKSIMRYCTYDLTEKKAYVVIENKRDKKSYLKEFTEFIEANSL